MANRNIDTNDNGWILFSNDISDPKLAWLENEFAQRGIDYRRSPAGVSGHPRLEVQFTDFGEAGEVLSQEIGSLNIDQGQAITWRDLPDHHPIFTLVAQPDPQVESINGTYDIRAMEATERVFPGVVGTVMMYEVSSSNLSAFGMVVFLEEPRLLWILYVVFKGGTVYRYFPIENNVMDDLCTEAIKASRGIQEASVGSLFHHAIKVPADEGRIACHKLDLDNGGTWKEVLPKLDRPSVVNKYKGRK